MKTTRRQREWHHAYYRTHRKEILEKSHLYYLKRRKDPLYMNAARARARQQAKDDPYHMHLRERKHYLKHRNDPKYKAKKRAWDQHWEKSNPGKATARSNRYYHRKHPNARIFHRSIHPIKKGASSK